MYVSYIFVYIYYKYSNSTKLNNRSMFCRQIICLNIMQILVYNRNNTVCVLLTIITYNVHVYNNSIIFIHFKNA